jgi:hypothetical protein
MGIGRNQMTVLLVDRSSWGSITSMPSSAATCSAERTASIPPDYALQETRKLELPSDRKWGTGNDEKSSSTINLPMSSPETINTYKSWFPLRPVSHPDDVEGAVSSSCTGGVETHQLTRRSEHQHRTR